MGSSADAILCYGIQMKEGWETDDEDNEHPLLDKVGYDKYIDGVGLTWHCCFDCSRSILIIEGTEYQAYQGSPKSMHPESLRPCESWPKKLMDFVEEHGLQEHIEGEPGWYLCSMYG